MEQSFLAGATLWFVLNVLAIWLLQGYWRIAAYVPLAAMGLAIAVAALGVMAGSNLAPIWVVFALPVCLAAIVLIWLTKGIAFVLRRHN